MFIPPQINHKGLYRSCPDFEVQAFASYCAWQVLAATAQ
jgi:hypothetical protein